MKKRIDISFNNMKQAFNLLCSLMLAVSFILPNITKAQGDSTAATKQANSYTPLVEFKSIQKNDNSVDLKVAVKAKINGAVTKLSNLKFDFFIAADSSDKKLGEAVTDNMGVATINCKAGQLVTDKEGKLNFKTSFAGKDSIESAEETLAVKRARLEVTPVKEDSTLSLQVKLVDLSTGTETPVAETDLGVYVKRMFSSLKVGEGKTDETGTVSVEIPQHLAGDAKGNLTLQARLDDNEVFGNLEASVVQPWGTPVSYELKDLPRALWSAHPPVWMMVTFVILMGAVWGHYLVIIIQLIRLRKEEPELDSTV